MGEIAPIIGVIAAVLSVLGAVWALIRWVKRIATNLNQRLSDLEQALQVHRPVKVAKSQLAACPGMRSGVIFVNEGAAGVLLAQKDGRARVRLDGQATEIEIPLDQLTLEADSREAVN